MATYDNAAIDPIEQLLGALANLRTATRETEATVRLTAAQAGADVATALAKAQPADTPQDE